MAQMSQELDSKPATNRRLTSQSSHHPISVNEWRWLVLVGTHISLIFVDGIPSATGVFLVHWREQFTATTAELSVVLSIQLAAYHFSGAIAGPVIHKFGSRPVVVFSGLISCIGLVLSAFAPSPMALYFTAGFLAGSGFGSTLNASTVSVAQYFTKYYGVAQSVSSAGSAVGMVIVPPLVQYLTTLYGWRGTYLILAGLAGNIVVCGMLFRPESSLKRTTNMQELLKEEDETNVKLKHKSDVSTQYDGDDEEAKICESTPAFINSNGGNDKVFDDDAVVFNSEYTNLKVRRRSRLQSFAGVTGLSLITNYRFTLILIVIVTVGVSYSAVMNHLVPSVLDKNISEQAASFLMSFLGIGSIIGRMLSAVVLGKKIIYVMNWYMISIVGWGLFVMLLRVPTTYGWYIVVSLCVGIFSGISICTAPIVLRLVVGLGKLGRAFGIIMVGAGTGCLIGPTLAGWIYDVTHSYDIPFYTFGALMFLSGLTFIFEGKLKHLEDRRNAKRVLSSQMGYNGLTKEATYTTEEKDKLSALKDGDGSQCEPKYGNGKRVSISVDEKWESEI